MLGFGFGWYFLPFIIISTYRNKKRGLKKNDLHINLFAFLQIYIN